MLFFNKLLPLFVLPFGLVCLLLVLAVWRKSRWPAVAALGLLYLGSLPFVGDRLMGTLEGRYPTLKVAEAGPADAIVVLGGILGAATPEGVVPNWTETVDRFEAGVALAQAGRGERLIFTGARRHWLDYESTEGEQLRRLAIARGVPSAKILVTRLVDNTATEAAAVAELLRADGKRRIILVTSGWHLPRAVWLFRRAGVDVIPFPVDARLDRTRRWTVLDFVPNANAWQDTETAIREWYGYFFYRLLR